MFHLPLRGYGLRVAFKTNWFQQLTALKNNKTLISIDRAGRKQASRSLRLFNENVAWIESYFSIKISARVKPNYFLIYIIAFIIMITWFSSAEAILIKFTAISKWLGQVAIWGLLSKDVFQLYWLPQKFMTTAPQFIMRRLRMPRRYRGISFIAGINITSESECDNKAVKTQSGTSSPANW